LTGPFVKDHLGEFLIKPVSGESAPLRTANTPARKRESVIDEVLGPAPPKK